MGSNQEAWTDLDQMSLCACVINAKFLSLSEKSSSSGMILNPDHGIVLAHGSILYDVVERDDKVKASVMKGDVISKSSILGSKIDIMLDRRWTSQFKALPMTNMISSDDFNLPHSKPSQTDNLTTVPGQFVAAFRNQKFHQAMLSLMPEDSWKFSDSFQNSLTDDNSKKSVKDISQTENSDLGFHVMSYFVILQTFPLQLRHSTLSLSQLFRSSSSKNPCRIGDQAEIVATPFGSLSPAVFFNSYSRGIVCNIAGLDNCWILSDARCIPGSEGGPLFTWNEEHERCLTGVITSSLCWKNNEWIGFSLACSLESVLHSLQQCVGEKLLESHLLCILSVDDIPKQNMRSLVSAVGHPNLQNSTVLIYVGGTWGSGVIVHSRKGLILTCSHVIKDASIYNVFVKPWQSGKQFRATVIYRQQPVTGPYDIAVLKCIDATAHTNIDLENAIAEPKLGNTVYAVGHALFNKEKNLLPSITRGVIAKVIHHNGQPLMVQSSCAVHPGASGGPLLNTDGHLVGLLVCNTRDNGNNSSFPHLNMVAPAVTLWPALKKYIQTGDKKYLNSLQLKNSHAQRLWTLNSQTVHAEPLTKSKL